MALFVFAHNFDTSQLIFIIFSELTLWESCKRLCIINPPNAFCVTALPCKILITVLVIFHCYKRHCFIPAISLSIFFPNFTVFLRIVPHDYLHTSFVSADVGNQLKVKPNAMVAADALMQQCVSVICYCFKFVKFLRSTE